MSRDDKKGKALSRLKHLNTSLFGAESLCGKGFEASEVFGKHLTYHLTPDLT